MTESLKPMCEPILGGEEKAVGENWFEEWLGLPAGVVGYATGVVHITASDASVISLVKRPRGSTDEDEEQEIDIFDGDPFVPECGRDFETILHSSYEYNFRITDGDPSELISFEFAWVKGK